MKTFGRVFVAIFLTIVLSLSTYSPFIIAEAAGGQNGPPGGAIPLDVSILPNCSIILDVPGDPAPSEFSTDSTSASVRVALDASLVNGVYMTIYAYPGNTSFDPDSPATKRLFGKTVQDGESGTYAFNPNALPLIAGYKVVAALNVPIGDDNYRTIASDAVNVHDDDGGFIDYQWPSVHIVETNIAEGADALHLTLTGDARLFDLSQSSESTFEIFYCVYQYPAGEVFDFEADYMEPLAMIKSATAPFENQEVVFDYGAQAKRGYRVRAVSYWTQDPENLIPKGNDYEFGQADDSVPVAVIPQAVGSRIGVQAIYDTIARVPLDVTGDVPEDAFVLLHSYDPASGPFEWQVTNSSFVGSLFDLEAGTNQMIDVGLPGNLVTGHNLVAVVLKMGGELLAVSDPVPIVALPDGVPDDTLAILETQFETGDTAASILINGCADYIGGQLIIAQYPTPLPGHSFDPDAPTTKRLGQKVITSDGLQISPFTQISNLPLQPGWQVIAYLYKYDIEMDRVIVKYSDPVSVASGGQESFAPHVEITTPTLKAGDDSMWLITNFDSTVKGGYYTVYMYEGDVFDIASDDNVILYGGAASASSTPRRVEFRSDVLPLREGWHVVAVLNLRPQGDTSTPFTPTLSDVKTVAGAPPLSMPTIQIREDEITTGDVKARLNLSFDERADSAVYRLYAYPADKSIESGQARLIAQGVRQNPGNAEPYFVSGTRLIAGEVIQAEIEVTAGAQTQTARSNAIIVTEPPDWGVPDIAIDGEVLSANARAVTVEAIYHEGYTQRSDYYCNITLYQYPASVDDSVDEFWEHTAVQRVGSVQDRRGLVSVPIIDGVTLQPGYKLIAKLRLPHIEWEGEEADYLSLPVRIAGQAEQAPKPMVLLYNLGNDTATGRVIREILDGMGIETKTVTPAMLNELVGYLAELDGFESSSAGPHPGGADYGAPFMIMSHLGEVKLNHLLLEMKDANATIDYKAIVTMTNRHWTFANLFLEIAEEHETFEAILELDKLIQKAEQHVESDYSEAQWTEFIGVLQHAKETLADPDAELEDYRNAISELREALRVLDDIKDRDTTPTAVVYPVMTHFNAYTGSGDRTARIDADHLRFSRLLCDGILVNPSDYSIASGSTIITLSERYLKTLGNGTHWFVAEFTDGKSEGIRLDVNWQRQQNAGNVSSAPQTGDSGNPAAWWIALWISALGLVCMLVMFVDRRPKQGERLS